MKHFKLLVSIAVLLGIASLYPIHATSSWTYVGLKGETINTILPVIPSSPNGIMVGTQTGIWHFEYTWWDHSFSGLPVHDIIKTSGEQLLAAAGNGSDSDGVYIGKVAAIGEPGTRLRFSLLAKCPQPTALAFQPSKAPMDSCYGTLYVGNAEGVMSGRLCIAPQDLACELTKISAPADPFVGTCESMIVGSDDNMLYAGGRADNIIQPGPGPVKYSWLLRGNASGLTGVKRMNATSIVEMPVQRGPDDGPIRYIAVATSDSGVQLFNSGAYFGRIPPPLGSVPILDIVPFQTFSGQDITQIVAATPSGVYCQYPPNADCIWAKMPGLLPGSPKCVAQYQGEILWSGTDSGVYRYGSLTAVDRKISLAATSSLGIKSIRAEKGNIVFEINSNCTQDGKVSFFDTRGRCVKTCSITQRHTSISDIGKGLFLFRIAINNKIAQAGRVMSY
jgi:hypothetical protein